MQILIKEKVPEGVEEIVLIFQFQINLLNGFGVQVIMALKD